MYEWRKQCLRCPQTGRTFKKVKWKWDEYFFHNLADKQSNKPTNRLKNQTKIITLAGKSVKLLVFFLVSNTKALCAKP